MEIIIIALLVIAIVIEIVILSKANTTKEDKSELMINSLKDMKKDQDTLKIDVIKEISEGQFKNQETIRRSLMEMQESTEKRLLANSTTVNKSIAEGLSTIQEATDRKLSEIQKNVDAKLDKNLNERLDESFKQVGERLESLYKSLGELKSLESGVVNLNKTLSNVKARGVYGEMALENILANILDNSQYDTNVATKPRSTERVEFAVKIPDKDNKGFIYLPIDSKFPAVIFIPIDSKPPIGIIFNFDSTFISFLTPHLHVFFI